MQLVITYSTKPHNCVITVSGALSMVLNFLEWTQCVLSDFGYVTSSQTVLVFVLGKKKNKEER